MLVGADPGKVPGPGARRSGPDPGKVLGPGAWRDEPTLGLIGVG